jgi:16S rRNA processing protein RimM
MGFLIVGMIEKAHGVKGECFVMPATDDVAGIYSKGQEFRLGDVVGSASEQTLILDGVRAFKGGVIARFAQVRDRATAETLQGRTLLIPLAEARPLEPGEYFLHDLDGLEVVSPDGARLGRVIEIYEGAAGHYLGVDDGAREHLIPLVGGIVREVDMKAGRIVVDPPPGLLDL